MKHPFDVSYSIRTKFAPMKSARLGHGHSAKMPNLIEDFSDRLRLLKFTIGSEPADIPRARLAAKELIFREIIVGCH
jgi:hypothetical protein